MQEVIFNVKLTYKVDVKSPAVAMRKAYNNLIESLAMVGEEEEKIAIEQILVEHVQFIQGLEDARP